MDEQALRQLGIEILRIIHESQRERRVNEEQVKRLKRSVSEWNQWREQEPNLHLNLMGANLVGANLRKANLVGADLNGANLREANLIGADLDFANLIGADLNGANLRKANLSFADLSFSNLNNTDLSNANFSVTKIVDADLRKAILSGANLARTNLSGANLSGANLGGSYDRLGEYIDFNDNYCGATLSRSILNGAIFTEAHFSDMTFAWVDLSLTKGLETTIHEGPSSVDINSVILPAEEYVRNHFLRGVGFTETQIEYLPSLLTPRPVEYSSLFISYAHQDEAVAKRLYTDLRKKDVPCWFALHDLRPGTPILRGLEEAIHLQDKFLLILSEHAVRSAWIEREVDAALHQEIKRGSDVLFPIRLDNAVLGSTAGWATRLQHRHIGDFTDWQDDAAYQEAFTTLLRHLKVAKPPTV